MPVVIHLEREIAAPVSVVWNVVTDLGAYADWNPFVPGCRSSLRPGDPIDMKVQMFPWFSQNQRETVFENVAGERFCYGLAGSAITSRRCHELRPIGPARTSYTSHFELSGWMSGLVQVLLGSRLEHGFTSMTDALVVRCESLAQAASR
ncbi:MAG TPA: SRPBCC domain-containing protein [Candidatus Binatia bacterium]|jgi:hypothetical protein